MDCTSNVLDRQIGSLQELSCKRVKLLEEAIFQRYVGYGEVVEWSMGKSLKEYIRDVVRNWWVIVGFLVELVGIVSGASGNNVLVPYWVWVSVGIVVIFVAQFLAYHKVRKQRDEARNEVESAISELESDTISVGDRCIDMARVFWAMGQYLVRGVETKGLHLAIWEVFQKPTGEESKGINEAERELMYKLKLLQLVSNEERLSGNSRCMATVTTSVGDSVIKELNKKWGNSPWPPYGREEASGRGGGRT